MEVSSNSSFLLLSPLSTSDFSLRSFSSTQGRPLLPPSPQDPQRLARSEDFGGR